MTPFIGIMVGLAFAASPVHITGVATHEGDVPRPAVPDVPFYSQFRDISAVGWQKLGCGIADLAMLIEFYHPGTVSVDTLLKEGVADGAYVKNAGWSHKGLAELGRKYGLAGESYDLSNLTKDAAFEALGTFLKEGPVIASVHYKFEPGNPIPHLAVITGMDGDTIYYNDPAAQSGGTEISVANFKAAWKKRFIVLRPVS